jgi:predicted nuclease of predicted toxin-antitoxin system
VHALLIDEGLPASVARALSALGLPVHAIGGEGAPPRGRVDEANCEWCARHDAVLVTNDRGRKDPAILAALSRHHVSALFVHNDLRSAPEHHLALALLRAEAAIDDLAGRREPLRGRLLPNGKVDRR